MKNKGMCLIYWLLALFMFFMSGSIMAYDLDKAYKDYLDFHNKSYEGDENPPTPQTKEQFLTSEIENAKQKIEIAAEMGFDGSEENEILNELENLRDQNYGETSREPDNSGGEGGEQGGGEGGETAEDKGEGDGHIEGCSTVVDGAIVPCPQEEPKEEEQAEAQGAETQEEATTKQECPDGCCGIKLNTNFPIIGNCIETKGEKANPTNAFPYMIGAITKIVMSLIMVICFILVIVAGIMRAGDKPKEGKELLKKVAVAILLLGFAGVILRLINPTFFS